MNSRSKLLTGAFAMAMVAGACGGAGASPSSASRTTAPATTAATAAPMTDHMSMAPAGSAAPMTDSAAADLRTKLDLALGEHIILAAKATGAALGGRTDRVRRVRRPAEQERHRHRRDDRRRLRRRRKDTFNKIWSAHNGFFVDYTTGVAKKDKAMQDKAVQDLTTIYVPQFAEFIAGATGLPKDAVTDADDRARPADQGDRRRPGEGATGPPPTPPSGPPTPTCR